MDRRFMNRFMDRNADRAGQDTAIHAEMWKKWIFYISVIKKDRSNHTNSDYNPLITA